MTRNNLKTEICERIDALVPQNEELTDDQISNIAADLSMFIEELDDLADDEEE